MRPGRTYDVVVVGAGGAGAVVAARLSEDPSVRVLLLEAGPVDGDRLGALKQGDSLAASVDPRTSWSYPVELVPRRDWMLARGRGIGGSTSVNAGYFIRAAAEDLVVWEVAGGAPWSAGRVLEAYRRSEQDLDVISGMVPGEGHGVTGPVRVQRAATVDPVSLAFVEGSLGAGAEWVPDLNVGASGGIGAVPRNVVDGVRWGTGLAYLLPAMGRENLDVRGDACALQVDVQRSAGGLRAVGVDVLGGSGVESAYADRVVLCAGAIGSARLLLASGIGPARELESAGAEVVLDLPVGESTSDHPQVSVRWTPAGEAAVGGPILGPVLHHQDLEIMPLLRSTSALLGGDAESVLDLLVADQRPESRGTLRLASTDPKQMPIIRSGYLATERDRRTLRDGVRLALEIVSHGLGTPEDSTTADLDDDQLDVWIRGHLGTALHLCGTAPLGAANDPSAAVDGTGHVRGVTGLQVIDLSVLPHVPSRGPAATAVMLGELLSPTVLA